MNARFKKTQLSLQHSLEFDKEEMLNAIIEASGMSQEIFTLFFVLEEYPMELIRHDDMFIPETVITIRQQFKIRRREMSDQDVQLALEERDVNRTDAPSFAETAIRS